MSGRPGTHAARSRGRAAGIVLGGALLVALIVAVVGVWSAADAGQDAAVPTGATSPDPSRSPQASPPSSSQGHGDEEAAGVTPEPAPPPRSTAPPVGLEAAAEPLHGLIVELAAIESVEGEAVIAGEVGGPAVRVTVRVTNATASVLDASSAVVNAYVGAAMAPAGPIARPGGRPFASTIAAGEVAEGVYLFTIAPNEREDLTVEVELEVGKPIVVFRGDAT